MKGKPPLKQSGLSLYSCLTRWGTKNELAFLEKLGLGYWVYHCGRGGDVRRPPDPKRRKRLLRKYKQSMALRSNWGDIDPREVMKYVDREIAKIK